MNIKITNTFYFLLVFIIFSLFLYGLYFYEESKIMYSLFSGVFFVLLFSSFYKPLTYSYIFFAWFLFLGFWLKLTLHTIFKYPYVEPIGGFIISHTSMDSVLLVIMIGVVASFVTHTFLYMIKVKQTTYFAFTHKMNKFEKVNCFYKQHKKSLFFALISVALILGTLNLTYNIQISGLVPTTLLIFPFNAVVYWLLGTGFVLVAAYFVWLEVVYEKKLNVKAVFLLLSISAIGSISILSRGQFIFFLLGLFLFTALNFEKLRITYKDVLNIILFSILSYFMLIYVVTQLRDIYFCGKSDIVLNSNTIVYVLKTLFGLITDRWVGLEGVMAVVSFPDKSFEFFYEALTHNAKIGDIDIYQYICSAHYKDMNNTKYAFASIPGPIAFFFYSGSYIIVFFGVAFLTIFIIYIEKFVFLLVESTLYSAFIGVILASIVAQFGLSPMNLWKYFVLLFTFILVIKFFEYILKKFYRFC